MTVMTTEDLRQMLLFVADRMISSKPYLTEVDFIQAFLCGISSRLFRTFFTVNQPVIGASQGFFISV